MTNLARGICAKCMENSPCWRKRPYCLYTEYCYPHELKEANPKLLQLIEKYGLMFDDYWKYRITGRSRKVVVREPLWLLGTIESGKFAEHKDHYFDAYQTKLFQELKK